VDDVLTSRTVDADDDRALDIEHWNVLCNDSTLIIEEAQPEEEMWPTLVAASVHARSLPKMTGVWNDDVFVCKDFIFCVVGSVDMYSEMPSVVMMRIFELLGSLKSWVPNVLTLSLNPRRPSGWQSMTANKRLLSSVLKHSQHAASKFRQLLRTRSRSSSFAPKVRTMGSSRESSSARMVTYTKSSTQHQRRDT
jgi:hypothetical protein